MKTHRYEILHLSASQLLPNDKQHLNKYKIYAHFLTNFACLNIKQTKPNQTKLTRGQCDWTTNLFYKHVFVFLDFFLKLHSNEMIRLKLSEHPLQEPSPVSGSMKRNVVT